MISVDIDSDNALFKASGNNFVDCIDEFKSVGLRYDAKSHYWKGDIGLIDSYIDSFSYLGIEIDAYVKSEIEKWKSNLSELKQNTTRSQFKKFNKDLLLYPPIPKKIDDRSSDNRSFQEIDITQALNQNRFLFNWPTGSGKAYATSAVYSQFKFDSIINKALILTSSIGILNMKYELVKFIPNIDPEKILTISSIGDIKDRDIFNESKYPVDIIIIGYDAFRIINDYYDKIINNRQRKAKYTKSSIPFEQWIGLKEGILLLDECHLLGNPSSLRTKSIFMNLKFFNYRYLFTATLADKREKLYPILKVLDEQLINGLSYNNWLSQYVELGNKWSKFGINEDTWNLQKWAELNDLLYRQYAAKRDKKLLGIPDDIDVPIIYLNMTKKHREIYEAFTYSVIEDVKQRNMQNHAGLIANMTNAFPYLQSAVDNPLILLNSPKFSSFNQKLQSAIQSFNYQKDFIKLQALDNIIEYECGELDNKIIIFYYHPLSLEQLKIYLKSYDPFIVSSDLDKEERFRIIESFKKSKSKILIASIMIASTSITLNECKANIYYENVYHYTTYIQSRGRISRIGQDQETRSYHIRFNNSIDLLQRDALVTKGKIMDSLIKKNVLSPEEWKMVFSGDSSFVQESSSC